MAPGNDGMTRLTGVRLLLAGAESTAQADTLALPAYAFEGRTPGDRASLGAIGLQRYCDGSTCTIAAAVELPSGASVTRIELDAYDNDGAADVAAGFSRCDVATGICAGVASVSTSDSEGYDQPGFDLLSPETIDNANFTYRAEVSLGATDATRLVGLRLFFDRPPALARSDRLAINPFAFEGREATDSSVLDVLTDDRFCNGQACTMLAPIELPSGTRVSRLELSAWDDSSADIRAAFLRCPEGSGNCVEVVSAATTGTPGDAEVGVDLGSPEVIDNAGSTYALEVQSGPNAGTALRGASLVIERPLIFSDGFGTGDTSPWSSTVQ